MYPKLEGRFPQVSGLVFGFNPDKPSGKRIDAKDVKIQDEPLDLEKVLELRPTTVLSCSRFYQTEVDLRPTNLKL